MCAVYVCECGSNDDTAGHVGMHIISERNNLTASCCIDQEAISGDARDGAMTMCVGS